MHGILQIQKSFPINIVDSCFRFFNAVSYYSLTFSSSAINYHSITIISSSSLLLRQEIE